MTVLLHPADPDFVWRSHVPPESPDWYFLEVHRINEQSVELHIFHYHFEGFAFCPIQRVQYPVYHVRHVKAWEEPFSLSRLGASLQNGIDKTLLDRWEGLAKDWAREVKGKTTKHNTCVHATL